MSLKCLENLEPFAVGFFECPGDDMQLRIASGMLKYAQHLPIDLTEDSFFADFVTHSDKITVKYNFGGGICIDDGVLEKKKQANPQLSGELALLRAQIEPYNTGRLFEESKNEQERLLSDGGNILWGGGWGGHANPDYRMFLHLGTKGLRSRNALYRTLNPGKDSFYDTLNMTLDALELLGQRTKVLAQELSQTAAGEKRTHLKKIAAAFENIPQNPPRDFFEAAQMFLLGSNFDGVDSPGLFDYTMDDYYLLSDEAERRQVLNQLWETFHKLRTWNLCIGRSDENGAYHCSQLTYDILETARTFRYNTPNLTMRVSRSTPEPLWKSAIETIATGIGMPVLYNDEVVCPALEELGIPKEDAHLYCMNGCNQIDIFGKSHMGLEDGEVCLAKALELTLLDGFSPKHGRKIMAGQGQDFATFDSLLSAYKKQVEAMCDTAVSLSLKSQKNYAHNAPNPYRSVLIRGCVEKGLDYKNKGPIYGHGQILAEGIADTADSLAAIRHFVYEEKKYSLKELCQALLADFEGYSQLYRDFSTYHKFGNDIPEVDSLAGEIVNHFNEYLMTKKTFRGGIFGGGCSTFDRAPNYGGQLGALPNGKRFHSDLLADSVGATPGADKLGPTALINSVLHYDQKKAKSGFVFNLKFSKSVFGSELGKAAFGCLAKIYFANGGQQMSVSVVSTQELKDALDHPELYENLIVRIGGYSDYFVRLPRSLQKNIICRSELCI